MYAELITRDERRELYLTIVRRYLARYRLPEALGSFLSSTSIINAVKNHNFDMQAREFLKGLALGTSSEYTIRGYGHSQQAVFSDLFNLYTNAVYVLGEMRHLWKDGFCCQVHLNRDAAGHKSVVIPPRDHITVAVYCELLKDYIDYDPDSELLSANYLDETIDKDERSKGLRRFGSLKNKLVADQSTSPALREWLQEKPGRMGSKTTAKRRAKGKKSGSGCLLVVVIGAVLLWWLSR